MRAKIQLNEEQPRTYITICIPYYSSPDLLIRAIDSVFHQTNPHWQLKIFDDNPAAPLDRSLIANFLKDRRVSYHLNPKNLGIGGNWNRCLSHGSSNLVTILHSDDELLPNYVDIMAKAHSHNPNDTLFFCEAEIIDAKGRPIFSFVDWIKFFFKHQALKRGRRLQGDSGAAGILKGCFIMCPTICYNTSKLGNLRFHENLNMVLDLDFYMQVLQAGESIVAVPEIAYRYRRHSQNQTSKLNSNFDRFHEESAYYKSLHEVFSKLGWKKSAKVASKRRVIKLHLTVLIVKDLLYGNLTAVSGKIKLLKVV